MNLSVLVTYHKVLQCALVLINRHLKLKKIAKLISCTTFCNFFCKLKIELIIIVKNGPQQFVLNFLETILGLDLGNSSSKTISKSYLNVGVRENQRNLQTRNFWTIPETLNSHKVRLN